MIDKKRRCGYNIEKGGGDMEKTEVTFELTQDLYTEWCLKPVAPAAKKSRRKWNITQIIAILIVLAIIGFSAYTKDYWLTALGFLFGCVFVYRLFWRTEAVSKKYYKKMRSAQNTDKWIRSYVFEDNKITIKDANSTSHFKYSDIINVTQDDKTVCLWKNGDMVFRLPKDSFVKGSPEELYNYFESIIPKK